MFKVTGVPVWQRWWLQTLAAAVFSILITTATHYWLSPQSSLTIKILVFAGTWVVGMIFQIAASLHLLHIDRLENKHVLEVINKGDSLLLELQLRLREIASRGLSEGLNRVFIDYCHRSLGSTLNLAQRAAQCGELEVRDHHFDTIETVLAAFEGCRDRTFRCVWLVEKDDSLFDKFWREYMQSLIRLSQRRQKNQRVQVRILFVCTDEAQLDRASVKTAFGFVSNERGFEGRMMLQKDYKGRLQDAAVDQSYLDFGIYGDHLLFRTKSFEPNIGVFSDDQVIIKAYSALHDNAMGAAEQLCCPTGLPSNVSIEEFLNCDSLDPTPAVEDPAK